MLEPNGDCVVEVAVVVPKTLLLLSVTAAVKPKAVPLELPKGPAAVVVDAANTVFAGFGDNKK